MKRRAYLETSVWNRAVDRTEPDRRRTTRRFLRRGAKKLKWFASSLVTRELGRTSDLVLKRRVLRQFRRYRPRAVTLSPKVDRVFEDLLARGIVTPSRTADMIHLALAITGRMDYLVSWDERHLSNVRVNRLTRAYCRQRGYNEVRIGTPMEVGRWEGIGVR